MEQQQTSATKAAASQRRAAALRVGPLPVAHLSSAGPFFPLAVQQLQQQDELQESPASRLAAFLVDCRQNQHLNLTHNLNSVASSQAHHHMNQQLQQPPSNTAAAATTTTTRQQQVNQQHHHLLAQQLFSTIILSSSGCWPAAAAARAAAAAFAAATSGQAAATARTGATSNQPLSTQCNSPPVVLGAIEATLNSVFCAEEHSNLGLPSAGGAYSQMDALVGAGASELLDAGELSCSEREEQEEEEEEVEESAGEEEECSMEEGGKSLFEAVPHTPQQSTIKQEAAIEQQQLISGLNSAASHPHAGQVKVAAGQSATSAAAVAKSPARSRSPPPPPPHQANSHKSGKPRRLYKCRHCGFETEKKVENWQHIRIHMRPEKLLACGSCQFVTEYKHHLEYHQRNHSGYKPFKCDNCDYQCVNKSMLNSHMKSHSSIYLYQCGDCRYATKYVHSLKMHLRKYNHQPAQLMIDVYGRKRGPKASSSSAGSPTGSPKQSQNAKAITTTDAPPTTNLQPPVDQHSSSILDLRVESKLVR